MTCAEHDGQVIRAGQKFGIVNESAPSEQEQRQDYHHLLPFHVTIEEVQKKCL